MRRCPVCDFAGNLGPSDHEPSCPAFMVGAIDLEGEQRLPFEEPPFDDDPRCLDDRADVHRRPARPSNSVIRFN